MNRRVVIDTNAIESWPEFFFWLENGLAEFPHHADVISAKLLPTLFLHESKANDNFSVGTWEMQPLWV